MIRRLTGLLAVALVLGGCALLPEEAEEEATPVEVAAPVVTQREIYEVGRGDVEYRVRLNASFGAEQQASLYFGTGGRIAELKVRVGDHVEAGQVLAELESGTLPMDVRNAEIDVRRKELTLAEARAKVGFTNEPSATDLERYELDLEQSWLSLAYKREQLANARLTAPFAGRVISLSYAVGNSVDAYGEVLVLAADGPVVARTNVDDATAAQLEVGQAVEIFPNDGNPTPIPGRVITVPLAGTLRTDKIAVFAPDEPSPRLQAGRNGRVEVILDYRENVLVVPLSAVRVYGGRYFVTVLQGETRQEVAVEAGITSDTHMEVLSGLEAGDRVVGR